MASSIALTTSYSYQQASNTYTLDQYIACQSDTVVCYNNLSFIDNLLDKYPYIDFNTYNTTSDYIRELREMSIHVVLSDDELEEYRYRPKLLCYNIYGNGEYFFLILLINDMYSVKQFNKHDLLLPNRDTMKEIAKELYNTNKTSIEEYNSVKNKLSV